MDYSRDILLAEFYNAKNYFKSLDVVISENKFQNIQIQSCLNNYSRNLTESVCSFFLSNANPMTSDENKNTYSAIVYISQLNEYVENTIKLPLELKSIDKNILRFINSLFELCFELHSILNSYQNIEIFLPTPLIASQTNLNSETKNLIPKYYINNEFLKTDFFDTESAIIFSLEQKRKTKHNLLLKKVHLDLAQNKYKEALRDIISARNLIENSETLTLMAWIYSCLGEAEKAKGICGMAIKLDSQYGPALNDMGIYLLNEGKAEESIRWFELAKRAIHYPNREYPYINSGRAYISLKSYDKALKELSLALSIAPHHEELNETISKLRAIISSNKNETSGFAQ